jgi:hypothetical protein
MALKHLSQQRFGQTPQFYDRNASSLSGLVFLHRVVQTVESTLEGVQDSLGRGDFLFLPDDLAMSE